MEGRAQASDSRYVIPARTISGSPQEMLTEIDDAVRGLLGLRQLIAMQNPAVGSEVAGRSRPGIRLWLQRLYGMQSANR